MACGACEPFAQAVQQHYSYLFTELGFQVAHCEDARQGEHCLLVAESKQARAKFELDQGTPVMYFGTHDSPISWANQVDGVTVWYVDNALLNFVERKAGAAAGSAGAASGGAAAGADRTTDQLIAAAAERLRPYAAELAAAFAPDRPEAWWRDFNAYQAERLQQLRQRLKSR
jgi:hypothetical protein